MKALGQEDAVIDREDLTPVEKAIMIVWGERCPDHNGGCLTCQAWAQYDVITRAEKAEAEAERLRQALALAVADLLYIGSRQSDPNEPSGDSGETVWDALRQHARWRAERARAALNQGGDDADQQDG